MASGPVHRKELPQRRLDDITRLAERRFGVFSVMNEEMMRCVYPEGNSRTMKAPTLSAIEKKMR